MTLTTRTSVTVWSAVDAAGFLLIGDTLQSAGGPPEVFAAGDVATSINHPRPKAGVYAVRQVGQLLAFTGISSAESTPFLQ
jgi:NADH dehydrogenase FAD-containing subunit